MGTWMPKTCREENRIMHLVGLRRINSLFSSAGQYSLMERIKSPKLAKFYE
jgi:hypothetical protein